MAGRDDSAACVTEPLNENITYVNETENSLKKNPQKYPIDRKDSVEAMRRKSPPAKNGKEVASTEYHATSTCTEAVEQEVHVIEPRSKKKQIPVINSHDLALKLLLVIGFVIIVTCVAIIFHFYNQQQYDLSVGRQIHFNEMTRVISIMNTNRDLLLLGHLGRKITDWKRPFDCTDEMDTFSTLCLNWPDQAQLRIIYHEENDTNCYDVSWITHDVAVTPEDCFDLDSGLWYGGALLPSQPWALNNYTLSKTHFVPGSDFVSSSLGPVIERYWLMSSGVGIYIHLGSPLSFSINDKDPVTNTSNNKICFFSDYPPPPFQNLPESAANLNYTVCVAKSMRQVHDVFLKQVTHQPTRSPPPVIFTSPVWSTEVKLRPNISQDSILQFSSDIVNHEYTHGLLLIENQWEKAKGDFIFDDSKFPAPSEMVEQLQSGGFMPCFAMHPYSSTQSLSFQHMILNKYYLMDLSGKAPGLIQWDNSPPSTLNSEADIAAVVDMTPRSQAWFRERLNHFQHNFSLNTYYLAGGDVDNLPFLTGLGGTNPSIYVSEYNQFASELSPAALMPVAYRGQGYGITIALRGSTSSWDGPSGLVTIIPRVLTLGLLGYPFILSDVIGGSAYSSPPPKELYIRWLQLSTFLPSMHFSFPPHFYTDDVVVIAKEMIDLHQAYVAKEVMRIVEESVGSLHPIIRPLWWIAPHDKQAHLCDSQFLVGDDILVAPILVEGGRSRDIYLPQSLWTDHLTGSTHQGPVWLYNHSVPIHKIAYFTRNSQ